MCERLPRRGGGRAAALALALAALVALGGCGGGGGSASTASTPTSPGGGSQSGAAHGGAANGGTALPPASASDAELIRTSIAGVLASNDPAKVCDKYTTAPFIQGAYGDRNGCTAAVGAPGEAARSVRVSAVSVSGDKATATAVPVGGPSNREKIQVQLVKQGGVWKVASLASNAAVGP